MTAIPLGTIQEEVETCKECKHYRGSYNGPCGNSMSHHYGDWLADFHPSCDDFVAAESAILERIVDIVGKE